MILMAKKTADMIWKAHDFDAFQRDHCPETRFFLSTM
jgi:hypothetical protein